MLYLPKIDDYLKILTDNEVKDSAVINFVEYFNLQEKFYSKLCEEQNIREVVESLYIFLKIPDEVKNILGWCSQIRLIIVCITIILRVSNLFDPELQMIKNKNMIKNKLKEFLSELKKFKV